MVVEWGSRGRKFFLNRVDLVFVLPNNEELSS
jgi:hypothetical protein